MTTEGYPKRIVVLARCRGRNPTAVRGDVADPFAEGANASSVALSLHLHMRRGGDVWDVRRVYGWASVRARVQARARALVQARVRAGACAGA